MKMEIVIYLYTAHNYPYTVHGGISRVQGTIGLGFISSWLKNWCQ